MFRYLVILIMTMFFCLGCQLLDNSVNGEYDDISSGSADLDFKLSSCINTPPAALPYSCDLALESSLSQSVTDNQIETLVNKKNTVTYELKNSTCTGLTISSIGRLEGEIFKNVTDTCSFTVRANQANIFTEKSLTLTMTPSIVFLFSQENIFLQEGQGITSIQLNLSEPAPFDTYVEFDIFGDSENVVSGISYTTRRILIEKGQSSVPIDLSIASSSAISKTVYQQIRLMTGSNHPLPGININSYESTTIPKEFDQVSAGSNHTCGITNGNLYCWGRDTYSSVGNGNAGIENVLLPQKIGSSNTWQIVSTGQVHSCGIDNGKLYCWGRNVNGQLGNGTTSFTDTEEPQQVGILTSWDTVVAGPFNTCAMQGGKLFCWGSNSYGKLGIGSSVSKITDPTQVGSSTLWESISLGYSSSCGINNGELFCWGQNTYGQQGNGSSGTPSNLIPVRVGSESLWQSIAVGNEHSCGIQNGGLFCWGRNNYGQVGNGIGTGGDITAPSQIGLSTSWQSLELGKDHSCGINAGKLFCWGSDAAGKLGNGANSRGNILSPSQIGTHSSWQLISAGYDHTCGVRSGNLYCWGSFSYGQLGIGRASARSVTSPGHTGYSNTWQKLSLGENHSCGIDKHSIFCWGHNGYGQVGIDTQNGLGSYSNATTPSPVSASLSWEMVSSGQNHSCGISNGRLFCWGRNYYGQVGNGNEYGSSVRTPLQIGSSNLWQVIGAGENHTCGINAGKIYCWGRNTSGQVGTGSSSGLINIWIPTQMGSLSSWQDVKAGNSHTCALNSNGGLFCWGNNYYGQIGNGNSSTTSVLTPTQIGILSSWQSFSTGTDYTCGISAGKLSCWGRTWHGQLGNGDATDSTIRTPIQIGTSNQWEVISTGYKFSCGIENKKLFCWGIDTYGQLGNGDSANTDMATPQQIGTSTLWETISTGFNHTCGIENKRLLCWGNDFSGQTGQSSSYLASPFLVIN